jgi:REP element-mobilizing transposase RayT
MANTYSQIYVHVIFAVQGRQHFISEKIRETLQKYINGIIASKKQKLFAIYCMPDHTHLLISVSPDIKVSELVRDIKANSSRFISEQNWVIGKFQWQEGFAAFSCSKSHADNVVNYILRQPDHHQKTSFKEEYTTLLKKFNIDYKDEYLFRFLE